jgi:hypothetical protein
MYYVSSDVDKIIVLYDDDYIRYVMTVHVPVKPSDGTSWDEFLGEYFHLVE